MSSQGNTNVSIWKSWSAVPFLKNSERILKEKTEELGMIFLSTPFSRAASDRLESMWGYVPLKLDQGVQQLPSRASHSFVWQTFFLSTFYERY